MAIEEDLEFSLVFEGNDGLAVAAEGGYPLQVAVGLRQGHDRAVAINSVAASGEIPASALYMLQVADGLANRRHGFCNRCTERRAKRRSQRHT
jgi:hypothetical protein